MKLRPRSIAVSAGALLGGLLTALAFCVWLGFAAFYGDDGSFAQFDVAGEIEKSVSIDAAGQPRLHPTRRLRALEKEFPQLWFLVSTRQGSLAFGEVPARVRAGSDVWDASGNRSTYSVDDGELRLDRQSFVTPGSDMVIELGGAAYTSMGVVLSLLREPDIPSILLAVALTTIILTTVVVVPALIVRPVRRAAAAADQIGTKEGARLPVTGQPSELRPLAQAFNRALDRIDAAVAEQRRFLSNAAHELRTPLTRLRTRLEEVENPETRAALVGELQSLSGTVTMLLQLARLTSQAAEMRPIDLVTLARDIAAREAPAALACGVEIEFRGQAPVLVPGAAQAVDIAVSNLIRNAVQHGGAGGHVLVEVADPGRVSVIDFGAGIRAPQDGQSILDPFVRATQDGAGIGLGLTIVAQVAALHRARLSIASTAGGGTTVSLIFPL